MTPRERILTTLVHKEPDRVPVDLGSTPVTGIMAIPYRLLKGALGIKDGEIKIFDIVQQLAEVEEHVLKKIGGCVLPVFPQYPKEWKPGNMTDGTPCLVPKSFDPETLAGGSKIWRETNGYFGKNENREITHKIPPNGFYFDLVYHPLQKATTFEEIDEFAWGEEMTLEEQQELRDKALNLYQNTRYALMGGLWGGWGQIYEVLQNLRGWDTFLIDLAINRHFAEYMLDKRVEAVMHRFQQYLDIMGDCVQVIGVGDDLGQQQGLQLSPDLYRKIIKPRQKKLYQFIKSHTDAYLFMHSCGSVYELIPDLIEIGVDILNPVQVSARNMDSKKLKREFGKDIVFWGGGCDTQNVLPFGTPEEVRDEVKRRIDDLAPGGGFVFSTVHNIQVGVPVENIIAMYQTVEEYGIY